MAEFLFIKNKPLNFSCYSFRAMSREESMSAQRGSDSDQVPDELANLHAAAPIPFVRSNALAPFIIFLNTIGAPVDRLLRQARVPPALLNDPEALLPVMSAYRFAELAARREKIEDIGVVTGQQASSFDLGRYGDILRGTATVLEYLRIGVRSIGELSGGTRMWLTTEREVLRVNQSLTGPPGFGRCTADLYTLVLTISTLRGIIGPGWCPGEVRLLAGDEALLGNPGIFGDATLMTGQRHSSFTISRSLLQLPLRSPPAGSTPGKDASPAEVRSMPQEFRASAAQLIESLLIDGYPSIQTAAEAAGIPLRTMQRRLAEAGVTYSGLIAASRLRVAKAWLTESDMPIAEIAATLGYTAASNFARAFRRQTGISPTAYRQDRANA